MLRKPLEQDQELPRLDDIEEAFDEDLSQEYYKEPILRQIEDWDLT